MNAELRRAAGLAAVVTKPLGGPQVLDGSVLTQRIGGKQKREVKTQNLIGRPAVDLLGSPVPRYNISIRTKRDQCEVTNRAQHARRVSNLPGTPAQALIGSIG